MNQEKFWSIINYSKSIAQENEELQELLIIEKLSNYPPKEIIEFEIIFRKIIIEADDYKIIGALKIIHGWVTDDPYLYFRCWLIAQGQEVFEKVMKNPDDLVDLVEVGELYHFEPLMYVSTEACEIATDKTEENDVYPRSVAYAQGFDYDFGAPPTKGELWILEELPILFPKLWVKYN